MKYNIFLAIFGILLLISCGKSYLVNEKVEFENQTWTYSDTLSFQFSVTDTSKRYNLYLEIDHSKLYKYQNIYMNVMTKLPNGEQRKQQLNLDLAEPDGKWKGDCKGENCKAQVILQVNAWFNKLGMYYFDFEQLTRDENLEAINSISFKIAENK